MFPFSIPTALIANAAAGQIQARKPPATQAISKEAIAVPKLRQGNKRSFAPEREPTRDKPVQR
jgi:hypothetical protein